MTTITAQDAPYARVFLGDLEISGECTAADPDEGWADILVRHGDGRVRVDEQGNALTARIYGRVSVEPDARS